MNLLLDTHLLLWAAGLPGRLSAAARDLVEDRVNTLHYSPVSLWEIAIKRGLGRDDFDVDPRLLCRGLAEAGYVELPVTAAHALGVDDLPPLHKDPFDRMLVAQARADGLLLLTADATVARYPGPIRLV